MHCDHCLLTAMTWGSRSDSARLSSLICSATGSALTDPPCAVSCARAAPMQPPLGSARPAYSAGGEAEGDASVAASPVRTVRPAAERSGLFAVGALGGGW